MRCTPKSILLAGLVVTAGPASICSAQTIHNVGVLPGHGSSQAFALSQDGSIAATMCYNAVVTRACRWTVGGGIVDLGHTPNTNADAYGCARNGAVIAGTSASLGMYRWAGGALQSIGLYYPAADFYSCMGVSGDGGTCFGETRVTPGGGVRAFRWTQAGGFQILGIIAGGNNSEAWDATPDGSILCGYADLGAPYHAFRWTASEGMRDIGATLTSNNSFACGISDNGLVVTGYAELGAATHAFLWRDLGGGAYVMQDLQAPTAFPNSYARDLSPDGSVVVGHCTPPYTAVAHVWTQGLGWRDLNIWLPSVGVNLTGWTLENAFAISADGTAIAGRGTYQGDPRGFVVRGIPCQHKPTILSQPAPASQAFCAHNTATLTVGAGGIYTGAMTYYWVHNGVPLVNGPTGTGSVVSGANAATLMITNCSSADSGTYSVDVHNACGGTFSELATLTVTDSPSIVTQPVSVQACMNGNASFTVVAGGSSGGLTYQWYKLVNEEIVPVSDGFNLDGLVTSGSQSATLTYQGLKPYCAGTYFCVITGPCGSVQTVFVYLTLLSGPPAAPTTTAAVTICPFGTAFFAVGQLPPANGPYTHQWQVEVSPNVFAPLVNGTTIMWDGNKPGIGGIVSGFNQPTMSLAAHTAAGRRLTSAHTRRYRCVVSNVCGGTAGAPINLKICEADQDCDGVITPADIAVFINSWSSSLNNGGYYGDFDGDGIITPADIASFINTWSAALANGC